MSLSKHSFGFSLIELMVVMAITAVLISLSGGVFQKNINQQEKHVELENVQQVFKQLAYSSYYQGKVRLVRLQNNQLTVLENVDSEPSEALRDNVENLSVLEQFFAEPIEADNEQEEGLKVIESITFKQLVFVPQEYSISTRGVIKPYEFGLISANSIKLYPLVSVFNVHE